MCLLNHFSPFLPWSFVIARFLFWHGFRSLLSYALEGKTERSVVYRLSQLHWHIQNMNYYPAELHWMLKIGAPNYKLLGIFTHGWNKLGSRSCTAKTACLQQLDNDVVKGNLPTRFSVSIKQKPMQILRLSALGSKIVISTEVIQFVEKLHHLFLRNVA